MIRHVVMWRFADEGEGKTKQQNMQYIRDRLMKPVIPQIKRMEIGIDVSHTDMSYDMMLLTEFDSLDDLHTYKVHPEHVKVSQYVGKVSTARVVADVEI